MSTFTAIDFETANYDRTSVCQVGLVRMENGIVTKEISLLVQPPGNFYVWRLTNLHGISSVLTNKSPPFAEIWPQIEPYIANQTVVAHNGAFDFSVLHSTLNYYGIMAPEYEQKCTYRIFKKKLNILCTEHGIELNHHEALSDARACAELFLIWLRGD